MKRVVALCLVFCMAAASLAADITLPTEVKTKRGKFVVIKAETEGKIVKWIVPDTLEVMPKNLVNDPKTLVLIAQDDGEYKIVGYSAVGDVPTDPAVTKLIVGDGKPVPPGPGPTPTPPSPADPLVSALQTAFNAETDAGKAALLVKLAEFYKESVPLVDSANTFGELFTKMGVLAKSKGISGKLTKVQSVIQAELKTNLSTNAEDPLILENRGSVKAVLTSVASAVDKVK